MMAERNNRSCAQSQRCDASGQNVPVWPGWEAAAADKKVTCWKCGRRIAISVRGTIETHNLPANFDPVHVTATCQDCGEKMPLNWVPRHQRTHMAERRLVTHVKGNEAK